MNEDDDSPSTSVFTPKKSSLSRQAIEKSLGKPRAPKDRLPLRQNEDRPSYSADHLNELKTSTPTTLKDLSTTQTKAVDLAAKFGTDLALHRSSAIPTDAEIQEKKTRRARLAKEQDFLSLDSDNDPNPNHTNSDTSQDSDKEASLLPYAHKPPNPPPSRLAPDDDDLASGYSDFTTDGPIALGLKAERAAVRRQKAEIASLIHDAEGSNADSSSDASEADRLAAYEAAQTRKGMDGLQAQKQRLERGAAKGRRPGVPGKITPLPSLRGVLERLGEERERRAEVRREREGMLGVCGGELRDVEDRKGAVRVLIREAGERFERLRGEVEEVEGRAEGEKTDGGKVEGKKVEETEGGKVESDDDDEAMGEEHGEGMMGMGLGFSSGAGRGMERGRGLESLGDDGWKT